LRDPTFSRFDTVRRVTHTHRQTHDDGYYPRIASAAQVKISKRGYEYNEVG